MGGTHRSLSIAIVLLVGFSMVHIGFSTGPLPEAEKMAYVSAHNEVRQQKGLPPVTWNDTVAEYAQKYAHERSADCVLKHSNIAGTYGENLAMSTGLGLSAALAVKLWAGEEQDYNYDSNTCAPGKMCGHYTQLVWRDTCSIGCACTTCPSGGTFVTCNYYPPGNCVGKKPY